MAHCAFRGRANSSAMRSATFASFKTLALALALCNLARSCTTAIAEWASWVEAACRLIIIIVAMRLTFAQHWYCCIENGAFWLSRSVVSGLAARYGLVPCAFCIRSKSCRSYTVCSTKGGIFCFVVCGF